jgi:hypothetical protein
VGSDHDGAVVWPGEGGFPRPVVLPS